MKVCCDPVDAFKIQLASLESKLNTKVMDVKLRLRGEESLILFV